MELRILGPLEVYADDRTVALGGVKPRAVLAVLALHANQPVSAERLALALWGEDAPVSAVKTVQVHVSRLRKALGDPDVLRTTPAGYRLRVRPGELDADRFEQRVARGRRALMTGRPGEAAGLLREALALWRGPPLAELGSLPFAPAEIARLEEQRLAALEVRVEADLELGRHAELIGELQQLTAVHPLRERLSTQLMLALYRSGRQADALEAYRRARTGLVEELGIEPGVELRDLHGAILAQAPGIDLVPVKPGGGSDGRSALPTPPTTLFGREADLDELARAVRTLSTRLITLVGPGGVGKTRLAIEAARRLAGDFADEAAFVALGSVSEIRDLAPAIAREVAAPVRQGESATAAVLRFLADRHVLLVLDNFEHLVDGAPLLAELLSACRNVNLLVTSREPTHLAAERLYPVQPLEFPATGEDPAAAEIECYGAVAMFCDRVRARKPGFTPDASSAPHVREICRRLDGLPLALELAAARVGLLSPAELAARLDRALTVLAAGPRDAPERQRTLRAAIDWSYGLLTDDERQAFARMAVFAGGATVAAAELVTEASLNTLDSLVAKQLVVRREDRLQMLETIREYALDRLDADPDRIGAEQRLAQWWLRFARDANPHLVRSDRRPWVARLDAELPNALGALSRALELGQVDAALELVAALAEYWWCTNRSEDGLPWLDATLDGVGDGSARARATALLFRARLTSARRYRRHRQDLEASLELFRACGDAAGIAACLGHRAAAEAQFGDARRAQALLDEALRFARQAGDDATLASVLTDAALSAPDYEEAARRARTAAPYLRSSGNVLEWAIVCSVTGYFAVAESRYPQALEWLDDALKAGGGLDDALTVFFVRGNQGLAWLFLDEPEAAGQAFREALVAAREAAAEDQVDEILLALAAVAAGQGALPRAACLAGAARAWQGPEHNRAEEAVRSRLDHQILAPARDDLGPDEWDRAERHGASLTAREAIDLALSRELTNGPQTRALRRFDVSG